MPIFTILVFGLTELAKSIFWYNAHIGNIKLKIEMSIKKILNFKNNDLIKSITGVRRYSKFILLKKYLIEVDGLCRMNYWD